MPTVPESTSVEDCSDAVASPQPPSAPVPVEKGGPQGPEPTRYGDWERKGRCIDF